MSKAQAIGALRAAFPRQEFPDESVRLYGMELADFDDGEVERAIHRLIRRSTWLPSIGEIRREVAEERVALPTPNAAWTMARTTEIGARLPTAVAKALDDVGGKWAIRTSTALEVLRAQFVKAYAERREAAILAEIGANVATQQPQLPPPSPFQQLPVTSRMAPRPVMERLMRRWAGREPGPLTEAEKRDAIAVLRDGPINGELDPLYREAEAIFVEADREFGEALAAATANG